MIGERLKQLRENSDLTKVAMGKILNMSDSAYHFYEVNKSSPPLETLIKIAQYFNVSVDYLLGLTDVSEQRFIKLSPKQADFINDFEKLNNEQLEILEIYETINNDLKNNLYDYADFCLQLEARERMKNVITLNASKGHNTPELEDLRQANIKNFQEHTLYIQLKNSIKDKTKNQ